MNKLLTFDLVGRVAVGSRLAKTAGAKRVLARFAKERACELGPGAIKMAQALSTRVDVVGKDAALVLAELQDQVPPTMSGKDVWDALNAAGIDGDMMKLDPVPYKVASIAQVHRGTLNGVPVAVKIQHPGVEVELRENFDDLIQAMAFLESLGVPVGDLAGMRSLCESIVLETDFIAEKENAERMRDTEGPSVVIPRVSRHSTGNVLIMEWVDSDRLSTREDAALLFEVFMNQVNNGVTHGDPHPGNVGKTADGRLVMYDFGCVATVPCNIVEVAQQVASCMARSDFEGMVKALTAAGVIHPGADPRVMRRLLTRGMNGMDLSEGPPFKLTDTSYTFFRAAAIVDGSCRSLDPDMDYRFLMGKLELTDTFMETAISAPSRIISMNQEIADISEKLDENMERIQYALLASIIAHILINPGM
jgi:predicted unusual protein kinase regulating ubiquinone biosynthesis (AarF/ABC1/UbiB family)